MQSTVFIVPNSMISNIIRIYHNDEASRKPIKAFMKIIGSLQCVKGFTIICVMMLRMILIHVEFVVLF